MAIRSLKKINSDERVQNMIQDNVDEVFQQIIGQPVLNGNYLTGIKITTGTPLTIYHKLDARLQGWMLTRNNTNAVIWDSQDTNTNIKTLILNASATTIVDILVF